MYKSAALPITLYEFEVWSPTLSKELRGATNNVYTLQSTEYLFK